MQELNPKVVDYLLDNTLTSGGATVLDPLGKATVPLLGFVCACGGVTCKRESLVPEMWRGLMHYFIENHGHLLAQEDSGIGTWDCSTCDLIHVDLVKWVPHEFKARHLAVLYEQVAYWDCVQGKAVYMPSRKENQPPHVELEEEDDEIIPTGE